MLRYIILICILAILILFLFLFKKGRCVIKSSFLGLITLLFVNLTSFLTGIAIGINLLTITFATILGVPGIILMIVLKKL